MTLRVVQWATGSVGVAAVKAVLEHPELDLVGCWVHSPRKADLDVGDIVGTAPLGVRTTDSVADILAMDADAVVYAPLLPDADEVAALLRSGKNVVSPLGPFYPFERYKPDFEKLAAACEDGGTSFHGSGIHPGFAGDLLPLTLVRIMERVERIHLYEVIDHLANPSNYIEFMGFGREPDDLLANPGRSPEAPYMFGQSMQMVAEGLGKSIEDITADFNVAVATHDIEYPNGVIRKGTVAGQHYEWSGWSGGKPLVTYHCFWTMGPENIDPQWDCGDSGYRVRIEGDPPMEATVKALPPADGERRYLGLPWTAMAGVNVIPAVCDAAPGIVTHFELGTARTRGLAR